MKTARNVTLLLFSLTALPLTYAADGIELSPVTKKLFDPLPQGNTVVRLAQMEERATFRSGGKEQSTRAYMSELRAFILSQLTIALDTVAKAKGMDIDAELYATTFLAARLETPFREKNNAELFEQDPSLLPAHTFAYYVVPYLVEILMREGIPAQTRDYATLISWARTAYIFLDTVEQFCKGSKQALERLGL